MTDGTDLRAAIDTLSTRAAEVRAQFMAYEERTVGHAWGPSELLNGFAVDVGDLTRLVMAKQGHRVVDDVDGRLAHELADCLWSVLVLARALDVDLGAAFVQTMDDLEAWLTTEA
jgi:NTP pyrophosphatase (non-canonical NTP hydrolase)